MREQVIDLSRSFSVGARQYILESIWLDRKSVQTSDVIKIIDP